MGKITKSKGSLRLRMHDSWSHVKRRGEGTSSPSGHGWLFLDPSPDNQGEPQHIQVAL